MKEILKNFQELFYRCGFLPPCTEEVEECTGISYDYENFNEVYGEYFKENPPARTTVEVSRLPKNVLLEVFLRGMPS